MREGLQKVPSGDDTIVAIATPTGRSAIGVVRLSGPLAEVIGSRYFRGATAFEHRRAFAGVWQDDQGEAVDEVVVTSFRAPHSYTGENVLEIGAHGNPRILRRIVELAQAAERG